jgi:D-3-phosphoglycerate dehydrogenase
MAADRGENSPAIFINASRGFLYEAGDLVRAVEERKVKRAAIDVYPEEPGSGDDEWVNPYAEVDEIVTTPHMGAATQEAQPRIAAHMAGSTRLFHQYGTLRDTVFAPGHDIGVEPEQPPHVLCVVHSDTRGTKKALHDSLYDADIDTLSSSHRDFAEYGIAYDINAIDHPLTEEQLEAFVRGARDITGDETAIRSVRQIDVEALTR